MKVRVYFNAKRYNNCSKNGGLTHASCGSLIFTTPALYQLKATVKALKDFLSVNDAVLLNDVTLA